jgi:hypothetical protein
MTLALAVLAATASGVPAQQLAVAWDDTRARRVRACEHRSPGVSRTLGNPRPGTPNRAGEQPKGAAA